MTASKRSAAPKPRPPSPPCPHIHSGRPTSTSEIRDPAPPAPTRAHSHSSSEAHVYVNPSNAGAAPLLHRPPPARRSRLPEGPYRAQPAAALRNVPRPRALGPAPHRPRLFPEHLPEPGVGTEPRPYGYPFTYPASSPPPTQESRRPTSRAHATPVTYHGPAPCVPPAPPAPVYVHVIQASPQPLRSRCCP
ncbi:hypothetical protein C8R44DRAFT_891710 [Mycena epipterygia]|nr:hypothetical protein C8R44DRAFT_891710 [Mycena epipterygia]